jgi:hypothetical protein
MSHNSFTFSKGHYGINIPKSSLVFLKLTCMSIRKIMTEKEGALLLLSLCAVFIAELFAEH